MKRLILLFITLGAIACGGPASPPAVIRTPDAFADAVVSFRPGEGAGFGQEEMPDIVLGPPMGGGAGMGSLNVLSLGKGGEIVLEFTDGAIFDGPGPDFTVFENPFPGWVETGVVSVSEEGENWREFPCVTDRKARTFDGCAGVNPVTLNGADGTGLDPSTAGGDAFDLALIQAPFARFVRIVDSGQNSYASPSGGFDLDAVGIVHREAD